MAKPNHLSVQSKISYALSGYMDRLIAPKKIKDNILTFFFSREYKEVALYNISGFTKPLATFLDQNNIKVSYLVDSAMGGVFLLAMKSINQTDGTYHVLMPS